MSALDRCLAEQAAHAALLRAGHGDRRGLMQACDDWIAEEVLIRLEEAEC